MGIGFTWGLFLLSAFRELFGAGTFAGIQVMPSIYKPIDILVKAPGAFLVLGFIVMAMNALSIKTRANEITEGCDNCPGCGMLGADPDCEGKEGKKA